MSLFCLGFGWCDHVSAEPVLYRFEAVRSGVPLPPPEGSVSALAATRSTLTGTFGYATDAAPVSGAEIPHRVAFASFETGTIAIDEVDIGEVPGGFMLQVTDGTTLTDDPWMTIRDEILIASQAISTAAPIDAVTLRLRYSDAERLRGTGLPGTIAADDLDDMIITFTTRRDAVGNRDPAQNGTVEVLGIVLFEITRIERVE